MNSEDKCKLMNILKNLFEEADTNKDGLVSHEDLKQVCEAKHKKAFEALQKGFQEADADKDGKLTQEELCGVVKVVLKEMHPELQCEGECCGMKCCGQICERLFSMIDEDGDGKVSIEDIKLHCEKAKEHMKILHVFFEEADADKDGQLTFEELCAFVHKAHEMVK